MTSLPTKSAVPMIEVTQKLSQGMSGLDEDGAVAGINHKGGLGEARDFAVHVKALTDWLSGSWLRRLQSVTDGHARVFPDRPTTIDRRGKAAQKSD
jgi:hypothetical protein